MSSVIGWFRGHSEDSTSRFENGLGRLTHRGVEQIDAVSSSSGILGVARYGWECDVAIAGPAEVAGLDAWAAAADGVLYYQADLRRRFARAGAPLGSEAASAASLILHAFRIWGPDCLRFLEGDFAFVVWNRSTDEVFAARDFAGSRPLYWAEVGKSIAVTSGVEATLVTAGLERTLIPGVLASNLSGYPALGEATHYEGVFGIPAGHCVHWRPGQMGEVTRWWTLPTDGEALSREEAAQALRALLVDAVETRAVPSGLNAAWLSGGWDSTAILGAAREAGGPQRWQAVSISYPRNDAGREDELIGGVAEFCATPVAWIDSESLPVLAEPGHDPFPHSFAGWLAGLATTASETGARVSFSGYGGDQLFQTSDVFLADLLRRGRLVALGREWMHPRWRGEAMSFLRWAVKPALPASIRATVASVRGGDGASSHLDRATPPWATSDFGGADMASPLAIMPRELGEDHAAHEMRWYLTDPYFPAVNCMVAEIALECGTEVRSPLMDERIVRLALSRPQEERSGRGETKHLLRQAMRGLLPAETLEPRTHRSGTTGDYFRRGLRRHAEWVPELFRPSRLADLGLIRPDVFLRWWEWFTNGGDGPWDVALCATIQTERWLQASENRGNPTAFDLTAAAHEGAAANHYRSRRPTPSRAGGSESSSTRRSLDVP